MIHLPGGPTRSSPAEGTPPDAGPRCEVPRGRRSSRCHKGLPTRRLDMERMALRIEDYGIIGDLHTVALVGRDGSIDWLCLPRFDSAACFAKLLGDDSHGSWRLAPKGADGATHRHYREDS